MSPAIVPWRSRRTALGATPSHRGVTMVSLSSGHEVFTHAGESDAEGLVLHGGPACTHSTCSTSPTKCGHQPCPTWATPKFTCTTSSAVYSDQPTEDLWNIDRWVEEVEEVRVALGLVRTTACLKQLGGILAMSVLWFTKTTSKVLV